MPPTGTVVTTVPNDEVVPSPEAAGDSNIAVCATPAPQSSNAMPKANAINRFIQASVPSRQVGTQLRHSTAFWPGWARSPDAGTRVPIELLRGRADPDFQNRPEHRCNPASQHCLFEIAGLCRALRRPKRRESNRHTRSSPAAPQFALSYRHAYICRPRHHHCGKDTKTRSQRHVDRLRLMMLGVRMRAAPPISEIDQSLRHLILERSTVRTQLWLA